MHKMFENEHEYCCGTTPTVKVLLTLFVYKEGKLFNKYTRGIATKGKQAGHLDIRGYSSVRVHGRPYYIHRLIFLIHHGYLPVEVDHIDGDPTNNRVENLRAATRYTNGCNTKLPCNNTSGVKGVSWNKHAGKWGVQLKVRGSRVHLGYYEDLELATLIVEEARDKYHQEFANHG